jgi:hypothetical protein
LIFTIASGIGLTKFRVGSDSGVNA